MFRAVLPSLCRRNAVLPPAVGLTLKRIQRDWDPTLTSSIQFVTVMRKIERSGLHFDMFDYYNHKTPRERDLPGWDEAHQFAKHLPKAWLSHNQDGLTHLHLGFRYGGGFYPKIDLRSVYFPKLKSLRLVEFDFSHDWQRHWIASHRNLQELYLVDCSIFVVRTSRMPLDHEGYPIHGPPAARDTRSIYDGRWYMWYHEFQQHLTKLRKFMTDRMTRERWEDFNGTCITDFRFGLSPGRYANRGRGERGASPPAHLGSWLEGYDGGALASLLKHTGQLELIDDLIARHGVFPGFWDAFGGMIPHFHPHIPEFREYRPSPWAYNPFNGQYGLGSSEVDHLEWICIES